MLRHPRSRCLAAWIPLVLALAGCGGGDLALRHDSPASDEIADIWLVLASGSAAIFVVVVGLLLWALVRRRRREATEPPDRGETRRARAAVVVGGIVVPAILLSGLFALTVSALSRTSPQLNVAAATGDSAGVGPGGPMVVDVVARQWFWDVTYGQKGVRLANEIHIPVGEPVTVRVGSGDVIHSLWVPSLNRKIDAIPGRTNRVTFEATRAGVFRGVCAEFCGVQHAQMHLDVVAQAPGEFRDWLARQAEPALPPATPELLRGQQVFLGSACVYCHTIDGTNASGRVGPDLTHLASRLSLAAGTVPNTRGYLAGWILDPQHLKPGNKMPGTDLSGDQLQELLDYLESLR